jgi:hypothetical protein
MPEQEPRAEPAPRPRVEVSVEPERAPRLNIGTRWKVVASSLASLWSGVYATLEEIDGARHSDPQQVSHHCR